MGGVFCRVFLYWRVHLRAISMVWQYCKTESISTLPCRWTNGSPSTARGALPGNWEAARIHAEDSSICISEINRNGKNSHLLTLDAPMNIVRYREIMQCTIVSFATMCVGVCVWGGEGVLPHWESVGMHWGFVLPHIFSIETHVDKFFAIQHPKLLIKADLYIKI